MSNTIKLSLISVALLSSLQAKDVTELGSITVISATKTSQSIQDVTSNVNVITSEEIEEKHYSTVVEALNSISGINFTSNGGLGTSTSVQVRGFDSKRVLVLIDGVRYNDITGINGAPFEHLMIGDIEQIEVVKGAQSGVWGADATAGVINIITKTAKKGTQASASVEYGSFNTKKYGALASYKSDNYYVKLSSQRVESDSFSAQAPRADDLESFEDDGYINTTSNIKLGFKLNDTNKIDASHTYIDAQTQSDPFNNPDGQYNSTTQDQFTKINFNHIDSFNEVNIYANRSVFNRDYPDDSYSKEFDGEVYEYGLKSTISYGEKDFLVWGVDYKTFEHKNDLNEEYSNKAIFLTNSNNFDGTIITESVRTDSYDKFDDKVTGKFGIKHLVESIDGLSASANYGTAYNVPTLYNLYSAYGSTDISAESTTSYDISIEYKVIKITYFNSDIEDMIDFDMDTYTYNNIVGTSTIKGYEIEYNDEVFEDIFFKLNYTSLDAKDKDSKELARRVKESANLSVDYYGIKDLHLGTTAQYIGERYDSDDNQGQQTGKYTLVNFIANYDITKQYKVYMKIDNITDEYYQVVDGYATAPRSAYAGLSAKF